MTRTKAKELIASAKAKSAGRICTYELQRKPPHQGGDCCVGGAMQLEIEPNNARPFPGTTSLAETLRKKNPRLDYETSQRAACKIITANDAGKFEDAWQIVEDALCFGEDEVLPAIAAESAADRFAGR